MQTSELRRRVDDALTAFLWREWVQLGVFGEVTHADRWAIDPEVLLLITLRFGGHDARLFDEVLDWLCLNGRLVSVQRLTNLSSVDDISRTIIDASLSWAGAHNPLLRGWQRRRHVERSLRSISLGSVRAGKPDPYFAEFGVAWPLVELSGKSFSPEMTDATAFSFRLRSLFGVGTRAEVMRVLLTAQGGMFTAQRIAEATAFAKRNIHETLSALTDAGPVIADRRGNELVYYLHPAGWAEVLDVDTEGGFPAFLDWVALAKALVPLVSWLDSDETVNLTPYMRASKARQIVDGIKTHLRLIGVVTSAKSEARGEAYWPVFVDTVETILVMLNGEPHD